VVIKKWIRWRLRLRIYPIYEPVFKRKPQRRRRVNIDLIEHLNDRECLVEINVAKASYSRQRAVQVMLTDLRHEDHNIELTPQQAWIIGHIIHLFDRRGLREFGYALKEGAETITGEGRS
jgi:hypothetical protein